MRFAVWRAMRTHGLSPRAACMRSRTVLCDTVEELKEAFEEYATLRQAMLRHGGQATRPAVEKRALVRVSENIVGSRKSDLGRIACGSRRALNFAVCWGQNNSHPPVLCTWGDSDISFVGRTADYRCA